MAGNEFNFKMDNMPNPLEKREDKGSTDAKKEADSSTAKKEGI